MMTYPKNPYCPINPDGTKPEDTTKPENDTGTTGDNTSQGMTCEQMLNKINELEFAITDLNLYLDTHPDNKEALEMLRKLSSTLKSTSYDYNKKCNALFVCDVSDKIPFEWASTKWPWQA